MYNRSPQRQQGPPLLALRATDTVESRSITDPCRLVRQVKQFRRLTRV